ncbi:MAG: ORF6N domain-containing protein, partial [Alistipes sp.]
DSSRSQIVILNGERGRNFKYAPFAFTEQGVAMLSSVLRSDTAIQMNRGIMRAFVAMRQYLTTTATLTAELAELRTKLQLLERNDEQNAEAVNDLSEDMRHEIDNIYLAIGELSLKTATPAKSAAATSPRQPIGYK